MDFHTFITRYYHTNIQGLTTGEKLQKAKTKLNEERKEMK